MNFKYNTDFIYTGVGAGGEFICLTIANNSPDYQNNPGMTYTKNTYWGDLNRYYYKDLYFGDFLTDLGLKCKIYPDLTITEEYIDQHCKNPDIDKRILARGHRHFKGVHDIFPNAKHTFIFPTNLKWLIYTELLLFIKMFLVQIKLEHPKMKKRVIGKWDKYTTTRLKYDVGDKLGHEYMTKSEYLDKVFSIIDLGNPLYSFVPQLLTNPAMCSKEDTQGKVDIMLSTPPEVFNTVEFLFDITDVLDKQTGFFKVGEFKLKRYTLANFSDEPGDKYCVSDVVFGTNNIGPLYNIKQDIFNTEMYGWHQRNLKVIKQIEDDIGFNLYDHTKFDFNVK